MATFKELSSLNKRRALITGATGKLGRIFAETLAELGADLYLVDLPGSDFQTLTHDLVKKWGVDVRHFNCDLEIPEERAELILNLKETSNGLNILVNNAALTGNLNLDGWAVPFEQQSLKTWNRALEVNLTAAFELCQGLLPLLKYSVGANIINISSIYGLYSPDWSLYEDSDLGNPAAYAVSKSGLIGLTRWLATSIAPDVRVNAIAPGGILRNQPEEFITRYVEKTPLKRMGNENDFRGAMSFLASDLSSYVTGQVLSIDGGWRN
jgi:NAD(P)-dependent dehydrogenase (short-subunit alcohol dehydrogenase family)